MPLVVAGSCSLVIINMKYKFYKITTQIIYIYIVNKQLYFTYLTLIQVIVFLFIKLNWFLKNNQTPILTTSMLRIGFQVCNVLF